MIELYFWPVTVSHITGLSVKGHGIDGYVISIPMTADTMLRHRERALRQIRSAVKLARSRGAKIVGLGALTSSLSRGGMDLIDIPGVAITTGHAYTGYTVTETLLAFIRLSQLPVNSITVAIVGAAGSIGTISAHILARSGVVNFIFVDVYRKHDIMHAVAEDVRSQNAFANISISNEIVAIRDAQFIITATNAPDVLVKVEHVTPGTIIVDDAQPSDVDDAVLSSDTIVVAAAGAVYTEGISANFPMGLQHKYDNFCCMAEVLILAANHRTDHYVINKPTLALVDEIANMGNELGFRISAFQNNHGLIRQEKIDSVLRLLKTRVRAI